MKTSLMTIAMIALSTVMFAATAQAANDPLVPCDDGYTYKCHGLMCGCEKTITEELIFDYGGGSINSGPDETTEIIFSAAPFSSSSSCRIKIAYEIFSLNGQLLDQGSARITPSSPSLVVEGQFGADRNSLRRRARVAAHGEAYGCTMKEFSGLKATIGSYEIDTGRTISHETLPVTSTFSIENGEEPPVKPAYIFPAYRTD